MKELVNHLQRARSVLQSAPQLVLGNPSADLDSVLGAVVMSYYLTKAMSAITVPVVRSTPEILACNPELQLLSGLVPYLIYEHQVQAQKAQEIHLIDCNTCQYKQVGFVVDHHQNLISHRPANTLIVEGTGSAISLVVAVMLRSKLGLSAGSRALLDNFAGKWPGDELAEDSQSNHQLLRAIYGVMQIDSFGFKKQLEGKRYNQFDLAVKRHIQSRVPHLPLYSQLAALKYDLKFMAKLPLLVHFKKDFKSFDYGFRKVGYSVVIAVAGQLLKQPGFMSAASQLSTEMGLGTLFVLCLTYEKETQKLNRQVIVLGTKQKLQFLLSDQRFGVLQSDQMVWLLKDKRSQVTRKMLEPLVRARLHVQGQT